jgi:crotonobetainyl-CoA:carnitine CoA-transferase CaiB-like acyl-CoA transferase
MVGATGLHLGAAAVETRNIATFDDAATPKPSAPGDRSPSPGQPLAGIRVVELATGVAGPYAARLLADYGADVVKVEPPGGDPTRREGARPGPRPDPERSPLFLNLNTNKRSVVADLAVDGDRAMVAELIETADVVVESHRPGALARLGLDLARCRRRRPELVVVSVTPFGQDGPYAQHRSSEIVAYALGGPMLATGDPEREPIKMAGNVVQYHCGAVAGLAALAAVTMADQSGLGAHVDVSNFETQAASIDRRATLAVGYQFDGEVGHRVGGGRVGAIPAGIYPTADGYCQIVFAPNWMPRVADMLGDDELIERIAQPNWLDDDDVPDLLNAALFGWTLQRSKQETMDDAQARQLAITPVNSTTDVLADRHFREREFWQRWDHPVVGGYEGPGPPFRMPDGWRARRQAPLLGQHDDEVKAELEQLTTSASRSDSSGGPRSEADPSPTSSRSMPRRLPLAGIRVLDLTVVWAGPLCTTLLGDLGAEVIRLDNPNLFPTATRGAVPRPRPGHEADFGQFWGRYPNGEGGERPWNRVAAFACHSRNKLGATLDLRTELGRATFLELVDTADVLVENNSIRVLPSLNLGWDVLHARNPRLITVRMPSLGVTGPYADYIGFGAHMEALCGLSSLRGYQDLDPTSLDTTYYMDPASGVGAAFATLCALRRRSTTGLGELVEFAQAENLMNYIGEYLVDASLTGEPHQCHGNRHPHRAPQGVYPCRAEAGESWLAISVADDDQWSDLVQIMGSPDWAADPALAGEDARRAHHDRIDQLIAGWSQTMSAQDAADRCRRRGIAAAPLLDERDLYADPHLNARSWFRVNGCEDVPDVAFPGHQWRWDGPPMRWDRLNMMGGDNEYVYRELLGKGDLAMEALADEDHLADGYRAPDGSSL